MIVGVESNFVLELAFRQKEAPDCTRILRLAEQRACQLVIPACALFEPYETLIRRTKKRHRITNELKVELNQLARTDGYGHLPALARSTTDTLFSSTKDHRDSLRRAIAEIVRVATVIPLDSGVISHSLDIQLAYELPPQDSVVFATIDRFFEAQEHRPKVFANTNLDDFGSPRVEIRLAALNCKLLPRFSQARAYLESVLLH